MEEKKVTGISLRKIVEKMNLKNLTPEIGLKGREVTVPDTNRVALQLTGYFENFTFERVQVIGRVEYSYMKKMDRASKEAVYTRLLKSGVPMVVYSRGLKPDKLFLKKANEYGVPVFSTEVVTSSFTSELIRWLNVQLAPCISVHGVLLDCYGIGVLMMGESGIGKSEAALELVKRGHRLVADDVVEIRKVSEETLVGSAPDILRNFIELRGIGIVDVKALFGTQSIREKQSIDIVIQLEEWNKEKSYDRLGMTEEYVTFLGNQVVRYTIPLRPGRNLAVIAETAAVNYRQKNLGYDAAKELYRRVQDNLTKQL